MFCSECGTKIPEGGTCPKCSGNAAVDKTAEPVSGDVGSYGIPSVRSSSASLLGIDPKGFSFLVLSVFFLNGAFLIKSIILKLTSSPLPVFWTPVSTILSCIAAVIFLLYYFKKTSGEALGAGSLKRIAASSILSVLLSMSFISVFSIVTAQLYKSIVGLAMDDSKLGIFISIGYFALVLAIQYLVISSILQLYMSVRFQVPVFSYARTYLTTLSLMLKKFFSIFVINIIVTLLFIAVLFLQGTMAGIIDTVQPYGFLTVFLQALAMAAVLAYMVQLVFNFGSRQADKYAEKYINIKTATLKPLLVIVLIALIPLVFLGITTYKAPQRAFEKIAEEIKGHESKGDVMLELGYALGAIDEYDRAASKAYSLRGLLSAAKAVISSNPELLSQSYNDLALAEQLDIYNGYISLFRGNISLMRLDPTGALNEFRKGVKNGLFLPEMFFGILRSQKDLGSKTEMPDTIDWLLRNEVYHDSYSSLYTLKIKKIDAYLTEINALIAQVEPKQLYKYYEKVKFNDHQGALNGLLALKEKYPENTEIRYCITLIYAEFRDENYKYAKLVSESGDLAAMMSETIDPADKGELDVFRAQMLMQTGDYVKAEEIYASVYSGKKDDRDIAETYAGLIIRNGRFQDAITLIEDLDSRDISTLKLTYLHSLALLNLKLYAESLLQAASMTEFGKEYTEEYDRLLYAYSLAYANAMASQEIVDFVGTAIGDSILYNYVMGMKGWKDKNSEASNTFMLEVEKTDPRLGYALYAIAVNYYEQAVRSGTMDFSTAIGYYLRSLKILPDHFEGYFALAHCYLKAGMKLEALRAFRRVIELVPYEDHRVDPYGIVVHSIGQISALTNELGKEAN